MDMDTPLTELFNLEMPVADDEDIPSTQPEHDDSDDCKEEACEGFKSGVGDIISQTFSWHPLTSKCALV